LGIRDVAAGWGVALVQPRRITIVRRYAISVDATAPMALMKTTVPWPIRL